MAMAQSGVSQQMRITLGTVIQFMESQAPEHTRIEPEKDWPPIAWVILQQEANGMTREDIATSLRIEEENITLLIQDLIQAETPEITEMVWGSGLVALRTSIETTNQALTVGWDQLEAMAIEKAVMVIQNTPANSTKPMEMVQIAAMANKATRRKQGELAPGTAPKTAVTVTDGAGGSTQIELNSGNVGSITLRLGQRVLDQIARPERIIDAVANRPAPERSLERLQLKETRGIAEQLDVTIAEAETAKHVAKEEKEQRFKSFLDSLKSETEPEPDDAE